jgi:flavodoxin
MENADSGMAGENKTGPGDTPPVRSLVIVFSYHHKNTEKIANAIAGVLDAPVRTPDQVSPEEIAGYDLVGFGSGIYGGKNHASLIGLAAGLPDRKDKKTFIFSTYGAPEGMYWGERLSEFTRNNHAALRETLLTKGCTVVDEFSCPGLNTNSFLSLFGGLNRGRPGPGDVRHAEEFAGNLLQIAGTMKPDNNGKLP